MPVPTFAPQSMVTGWAGDRTLWVTSPAGRYRVQAQGRRPGDRRAGAPTPRPADSRRPAAGCPHHRAAAEPRARAGPAVGGSAVVVGAELVSWSAVLTLRHAGCRTALMTTQHPRPESYAAFTIPGRPRSRFRSLRRPPVTRSHRPRPSARRRGEDLVTGRPPRRPVRRGGLHRRLDPRPRAGPTAGPRHGRRPSGPVVDTALRTSADGVFAAGNLLHPVDTADVAALDGRHVAEQVRRLPGGRGARAAGSAHHACAEPFTWVSPGVISAPAVAPPRSRVLLWSHRSSGQLRSWRCARRSRHCSPPDAVAGLSWPGLPGAVGHRSGRLTLAGGDVVVSLA